MIESQSHKSLQFLCKYCQKIGIEYACGQSYKTLYDRYDPRVVIKTNSYTVRFQIVNNDPRVFYNIAHENGPFTKLFKTMSYLIKCKDCQRQNRQGHEGDPAKQGLPPSDAVDNRQAHPRRQHLHEAEADRGQSRTELVAEADLKNFFVFVNQKWN